MGRTKEYKISRVIGETEEELKERIVEAINTHPGSLSDEAMTIQPDEVEYIRARSGPFIAQVKESHKEGEKSQEGICAETRRATGRSPRRTREAQEPGHGEPDRARVPNRFSPG
jgi:hypothetical protein